MLSKFEIRAVGHGIIKQVREHLDEQGISYEYESGGLFTFVTTDENLQAVMKIADRDPDFTITLLMSAMIPPDPPALPDETPVNVAPDESAPEESAVPDLDLASVDDAPAFLAADDVSLPTAEAPVVETPVEKPKPLPPPLPPVSLGFVMGGLPFAAPAEVPSVDTPETDGASVSKPPSPTPPPAPTPAPAKSVVPTSPRSAPTKGRSATIYGLYDVVLRRDTATVSDTAYGLYQRHCRHGVLKDKVARVTIHAGTELVDIYPPYTE